MPLLVESEAAAAAAAEEEEEEEAVVAAVAVVVAALPPPAFFFSSPSPSPSSSSSPSSPASIEIMSSSKAASSSGDRVGRGGGSGRESMLLSLPRGRRAAELKEATPLTPTLPPTPTPGRRKLRGALAAAAASLLPGRDHGAVRSLPLLYPFEERLDVDAKRQKSSRTTPEAAARGGPSERRWCDETADGTS